MAEEWLSLTFYCLHSFANRNHPGTEFVAWNSNHRQDSCFDHGRHGKDGRIAEVSHRSFSCGSCISWLPNTLAMHCMPLESRVGDTGHIGMAAVGIASPHNTFASLRLPASAFNFSSRADISETELRTVVLRA